MSRRVGLPVSYQDEREPRVTPDGMTWIDQDGNPPELDKEGRLRAPFTTVDRFRTERWGAGTRLPLTPVANAAIVAAAAALAASKRPTGSDNGAHPGNSPKEDDMSAAGTKAATKSFTKPAPKPSAKKKGVTTKAVKQAVVGADVKVVKKGKRVAGAHPHSAGGALEDLKGASPSVKQEHPLTDHLDKAKREGVRVASASRGGFHVIVFGTLNRAIKGVFPEAAQAQAAAVAAGLDVKGMPR